MASNFNLCAVVRYVSKVEVSTGKDTSGIGSIASSIVLKLTNGLLDHARSLYIDNWYDSVPLAKELIWRKAYLARTIKNIKAF